MSALLDLDCYLEPRTNDWVCWVVDTHDYRHKTKVGRMTEIATEQAIKTVERKGPAETSVHTLAKALGCDLEYRGHHCYLDGMRRTWEQAHKHLVTIWKLAND